MVVIKGDEYYSDTDSDDDVYRYVFLARQPAPPAGRHAEEDEDHGESSANDDDDDDGEATEDDKEEPERGRGRMRKRKLRREISNDVPPPPPPPPKKARVELTAPSFVRTQLSGSGSETESDSAPLGVRAGESGSEGSHEKAHGHRAPGKKRGVFGKRKRGPGCEEDGGRESHGAVAAAAAAAAKTATNTSCSSPTANSGRFLCNQCERCFDSHQALGGHVLGHRKKEKIAIAAAASLDLDDAGGAGNFKEETAVAEMNDEETPNGIAQADDMMMAVVAARRGKGNGGGSRDGKIKTVDFVAEHREDVDDDHVNGNPDFSNKGNAEVVSGRDFTNGKYRSKDKMGIGAAIKVVVGACNEGANGDGNVGRTLYKCKVCGTECTTGRALGGHMRKHRKRPPPSGGEGRSPSPPTDDDYQMPLARLFGAETGLQRENEIGFV